MSKIILGDIIKKKTRIICVVSISLLIFISIFSSAAGQENDVSTKSESSWPTYSHDYQRTGYTEVPLSENGGEMKWKYKAGENYPSSPTVDSDENIYFSSKEGLYSLNDAGEVNWIFDSNAASSPTIGPDGNIFVGTAEGKILCIDNQGEEIWSYRDPQGNLILSSPIVTDENVYITSTKPCRLYVLYKENGTERENKYLHPGFVSSPAIDSEGRIYLSGSDWFHPADYHPSTYAFYPNGTIAFRFIPEEYKDQTTIFSDPTIGKDGKIYVAFGEHLYSLNKNGDVEWQVEVGEITTNSPSIDKNGTVYVGTKEGLRGVTKDGIVWQMDIEDVSTPVISSDGCIIAGMNKSIYSVNIEDKQVNWKHGTDGRISTSPAVSEDGSIYVFSDDGNLYAIGSHEENDESPAFISSILFGTLATFAIIYRIKRRGDYT